MLAHVRMDMKLEMLKKVYIKKTWCPHWNWSVMFWLPRALPRCHPSPECFRNRLFLNANWVRTLFGLLQRSTLACGPSHASTGRTCKLSLESFKPRSLRGNIAPHCTTVLLQSPSAKRCDDTPTLISLPSLQSRDDSKFNGAKPGKRYISFLLLFPHSSCLTVVRQKKRSVLFLTKRDFCCQWTTSSNGAQVTSAALGLILYFRIYSKVEDWKHRGEITF